MPLPGLREGAFDTGFDNNGYREALGRLPLPAPDEIERAFVDVVCEHQPVGADEVGRLVAARLGLLEDQLTERILDRFEEELVRRTAGDDRGPPGARLLSAHRPQVEE